MDAEGRRQSDEPADQRLPEPPDPPAEEKAPTAFRGGGRGHRTGAKTRPGVQCLSGRLEQWNAPIPRLRVPVPRFSAPATGKADYAARYPGGAGAFGGGGI